MGNTVGKSDCINLEGQEITRDSYTVKRTSQQMEDNWVMGDDDGINEWRKMVIILLEELEEVRVQAELRAKEATSTLDEEPKRDPYDHKVETCPCGICETARYHRDTWNSSK